MNITKTCDNCKYNENGTCIKNSNCKEEKNWRQWSPDENTEEIIEERLREYAE